MASVITRLNADALTLAYDGRTVAEDLAVTIPDRSFTVIVGPNACGKTTFHIACKGVIPSASAAAAWPFGTLWIPARMISE